MAGEELSDSESRPTIFIDGDACPVKDEVYGVAARLRLPVIVVANQHMYVPDDLDVKMVVVDDGPDVADDWIAEKIGAHDVVITADIPLAARCLEVKAHALGTNGREFTPESIGSALAMRDINASIRETGVMTGGPAPFTNKDRSRFLNALDAIAHRAMRGG